MTGAAKIVTRALPKPVSRIVAKPLNAAATLVTRPGVVLKSLAKGPVLGVAELAAKVVAPKTAPIVSAVTSTAASLVPGGGLGTAATKLTTSLVPSLAANFGGSNMALNIGGILGQVSGGLKGFGNPGIQLLSTGAGIASSFFNQPTSGLPAMPANSVTPVAAKSPGLPAITGGAVGSAVSRGFFNRFPNLSVGLQQLRARGIKANRSRLYTILRRFGPEVVISGGLLTAAAVNELMVAGAGRRRMNVGNVKALKRSMRRMEGFHKLCVRADSLRSRGKRRTKC